MFPIIVVRADLSPREKKQDGIPVAAWKLPFADQSIKAIILNHSLKHFDNLSGCIGEIARVLAPDGWLYISVPDASTVTDRLYRRLAQGGGHVNLFRDPDAVTAMITKATGLEHSRTRLLCTSLSFLNRRNNPSRVPRKLECEEFGMPLPDGPPKRASWIGLRTRSVTRNEQARRVSVASVIDA
jgi:SAM-dependent methyltransferase